MSNPIDGKLLIVTSAPSHRDTIYVGYAERHGDMLLLRRASMILRYEDVGAPGLSSHPEKAVRIRPVTMPDGLVVIPLRSVSSMVIADPEAWAEHLEVSRG